MQISMLNRFFPGCKIVHIIRDGRDVAVSGWFHNIRKTGDEFVKRFGTMATYVKFTTKDHWCRYIGEARRFGVRNPDRYFELRYEDMHSDPQPLVGRLLQFLSVDDSADMIDRCLEAGSFKKLSKGRSSGEEDRTSFFRKGVVGDWRQHLDPESVEAFMEMGGDLLRELGYETD